MAYHLAQDILTTITINHERRPDVVLRNTEHSNKTIDQTTLRVPYQKRSHPSHSTKPTPQPLEPFYLINW